MQRPRNERTNAIGAPLTSLASPICNKNRHQIFVFFSMFLALFVGVNL